MSEYATYKIYVWWKPKHNPDGEWKRAKFKPFKTRKQAETEAHRRYDRPALHPDTPTLWKVMP